MRKNLLLNVIELTAIDKIKCSPVMTHTIQCKNGFYALSAILAVNSYELSFDSMNNTQLHFDTSFPIRGFGIPPVNTSSSFRMSPVSRYFRSLALSVWRMAQHWKLLARPQYNISCDSPPVPGITAATAAARTTKPKYELDVLDN